MDRFPDRLASRLVPAALTAIGVMLVAAGLLSYTGPVGARIPPSDAPAFSPPVATATPPASPIAPSGTPASSPTTSAPADRVATRVVVPALRIDLPVVRPTGGSDAYPLCNVAMYLEHELLGQPGEGRATYLYAHARTGMFLPILDASKIDDGEAMKGMLVQVYTSDDQLFLYEVTGVRRHQTTLDGPLAATSDELWLQTSEGPRGTPGKTQVVARLLSSGPADPAAAHPDPKPVVCG